ncbi:MAG: aldehyde dehydrogenase family protein [Burkholderiales bacterium]
MTVNEAANVRKASFDLGSQLYIGGRWVGAADGGTLDVINPATEKLLTKVAAAKPEDVDAAVRAARFQFEEGDWSKMTGAERGRLIYRLAELIERDKDHLAMLETLNIGRPLMEPTILDLPMAIDTVRYFAGWADKIEGRTIPTPGYFGMATLSYTVREPMGVVGAITPWNTPLMIACWKLAPALAAGCTVVIKPSEEAPLTTLHLARLIEEAGFPPGVVNVIPGLGEVAGAALARHPGVDKISFTGSPEVGQAVMHAAAAGFKRVALELGGKSPQIVLADANVEAAIGGAALGLFFNQGQVCAAGTRVLVHRSCYDKVLEGLIRAADAIKLGDPLDPQTNMGSLVSLKQLERVAGYVDTGVKEGAKLVAGGRRLDRPGYFFRPTIFAQASNDMRIAQEEIFGPVGAVMAFDDPAEAVRIANGTRYGLAATIWTRDVSSAHQMASKIRAGAVSINGWATIDARLPWGGVKTSGIGRELGWNGIEAVTEEKVVTVVL